MASLNKVLLIGNLTKDPEFQYRNERLMALGRKKSEPFDMRIEYRRKD